MGFKIVIRLHTQHGAFTFEIWRLDGTVPIHVESHAFTWSGDTEDTLHMARRSALLELVRFGLPPEDQIYMKGLERIEFEYHGPPALEQQ